MTATGAHSRCQRARSDSLNLTDTVTVDIRALSLRFSRLQPPTSAERLFQRYPPRCGSIHLLLWRAIERDAKGRIWTAYQGLRESVWRSDWETSVGSRILARPLALLGFAATAAVAVPADDAVASCALGVIEPLIG